jgi:dihydropteroate synthase
VLEGLGELRRERSFRLSLDSRHPDTVAWALERGVDMVNDVGGFADEAMLEAVADADVDLVFMHALSVPVVRGETLPAGRDPVEVLLDWAGERLEAFDRHGIPSSRLHFDPGVGFGKSAEQSWRLVGQADRFHALGIPLLVGHSRKSFLATVTDRPAGLRDEATVEVSVPLARKGIETLRVHDPARHTRRFRAEEKEDGDRPWVLVGS